MLVSCRGGQKSRLRANARGESKKNRSHIEWAPETIPSEYVSTRSQLASTTPMGQKGQKVGSGGGERNPSLRHYSPSSARMWISTWIVLPGDSREPQTLNLDLRPSRTGNAHSARQKPNLWMNVPSGQVAKTQTNNFSKTISTHTKVIQTQQNKTS